MQRTLEDIYHLSRSSMISVLSGPNLTLELSTFDLLKKKTSFFLVDLRPPRKKQFFFSSTFGESSKIRNDPERTDIILLKVGFRERFNLCSYLRENKAQTSKTKAES